MSGAIPTVDRRIGLKWVGLFAACAVLAAIGVRFVSAEAGMDAGRRWILVTAGVLVWEAGFLGYHLVRGRPGRSLRSDVGLANAVTLLRGVLFAAVAGFLLVPPSSAAIRWVPAVCYGVGVILDFGDGLIARRTGSESDLGARLDHAFDTLGFLVAPLVGVLWGRLPVIYLSLSAARYLFRAGELWRRHTGKRVWTLPESRLRRWLAAFQMVVITVALAPVVPVAIVHPAATIALVPSLAMFARDWVAVSRGVPGGDGTGR